MKLGWTALVRWFDGLVLLLSMIAFFSSCKKEEQFQIKVGASVPEVIWTNQRKIPISAIYSSSQGIHSKLSVEWTWLKNPDGAPQPGIGNPKSASTYIDSVTFAGSYTLRLVVRDQEGSMVSRDYGIQVFKDTLANYVPKADAGEDQEIMLPKNEVSLNGYGSLAQFPEGRSLLFQWSVISKPAGSGELQLQSSTESFCTVKKMNTPGNYRFQLRVQTEAGKLGFDTVEVRVLPDSLSGKSIVFDPVVWQDFGHPIGAYKGVVIAVYDERVELRSPNQLQVQIWNAALNDWYSPDKYDWEMYDDGWYGKFLMIHNNPATDLIYYSVVGQKTKVKVNIR